MSDQAIEREKAMNPKDPTDYPHDSRPPGSHDYLWPVIRDLCREYRICSILDIGCGNGTLCAALRQEGIEAVGMEPSQQGFDLAKGLLGHKGIYQIGVDDPPSAVAEGRFDAVVSTEGIEHLQYPSALLRFASAKLDIGGLLILSTPYHGYLKNLLISLGDGWDAHHQPLFDGGHIKFWSRSTLRALLDRNGFDEITCRGAGRMWGLWKSMVMVGRKR